MSDNINEQKDNKDVLLAMALASGATPVEAAAQLEISRWTIQRRMADPEFRKLVSNLRGEMLASAMGRISDSMAKAAQTVAGLLDAPEPYLRLRAARMLFQFGLKMRDTVDLAERIENLDAQFESRQAHSQV